VTYASFHLLDDAQLWFHQMELNGGAPPWPEFVRLLNNRFGPPMTDTPPGDLTLLCRTGNVDDFCGKFMALSYCDHTLTEGQQIQLFTTGLGEPLCTDVVLQQPTSLNDVVMFTRAYEQRLHHSASVTPTSTRTGSHVPPSRGQHRRSYRRPVQLVHQHQFSHVEIAERHALGLCFKCDEKFIPGHREACKRLFTIELLDEDDAGPMISIHTLTGIHSRSAKMMQVSVRVGHTTLTTLLSSGSTHNFLDTAAVTRADVMFDSGNNFTVIVANGDRITNPGRCQQLRIAIIGKPSTSLATAWHWAPLTWY
jgi:hypothetical protein